MLVIIARRPIKVKWKAILKIVLLIGLLLYIIPKLVLAVSGVGHPPPIKQKLQDDPVRETPLRVESTVIPCS